MQTKIILDDRALNKAIRLVPKALKRELSDGMDRIGKGFLKRWRRSRLQGPPGVRGASGRGLFGTFRLAQLFGSSADDIGIHIFSESKVAALHEEGGTVTAKGGGKMAVPLRARTLMFTAKGKLRGRYKQPGRLKNVIPMKFNGKTFLVRVAKRAKTILPLYVLKHQVRIKPRLEFEKTFDSLANRNTKIINDKVKIALREL